MKNFTFAMLLLSFFLSSCQKKSCCTIIDAAVELSIVDHSGNNLLAPPSTLKDSIKIYYVENGTPILFDRPTADAPKGFAVISYPNNSQKLKVFLNIKNADKEMPVTIISFGNKDMNRIRVQYFTSQSTISSQKMWYNDELKFDGANTYDGLPTFTIVR